MVGLADFVGNTLGALELFRVGWEDDETDGRFDGCIDDDFFEGAMLGRKEGLLEGTVLLILDGVALVGSDSKLQTPQLLLQ